MIKLGFKVTIGIVIFILLVTAYYCKPIINISSNKSEQKFDIDIGNMEYKGTFLMPVENFIAVTSKWGKRQAHGVVNANHKGIDLCGSLGSRVMAVKNGEVTWAGKQKEYGNCVEIRHISGDGTIFYTFYAHMRDESLCVVTGQQVYEGQVIGVQGSTGNSTGDHLHFEIRLENKSTIDPAPYLFNEI